MKRTFNNTLKYHGKEGLVEIGVDALMPFAEMKTICGGDLTSELPVNMLEGELVLSSNHTRDALRPMA